MLVVLIISDDDVVCHSYSDISALAITRISRFYFQYWLVFLQALKTKHDTPKYGLIYHAQLVGQASSKLKGKVRILFFGYTEISPFT